MPKTAMIINVRAVVFVACLRRNFAFFGYLFNTFVPVFERRIRSIPCRATFLGSLSIAKRTIAFFGYLFNTFVPVF